MLQAILVVSTLLGSWLGMQAVHELGHIGGAWLTGGRVAKVVLHPARISRTDLSDNPLPLPVAWAGPLFGAVAPILMWLLACVCRMPGAFVLRFFAGFCLVANGLYIGIGSFDRVGDCGELLQNGAALWHLWLFGACVAPPGFLLWNGQGRHFGFGSRAESVNGVVASVTLLMCSALLLLGVLVGE